MGRVHPGNRGDGRHGAAVRPARRRGAAVPAARRAAGLGRDAAPLDARAAARRAARHAPPRSRAAGRPGCAIRARRPAPGHVPAERTGSAVRAARRGDHFAQHEHLPEDGDALMALIALPSKVFSDRFPTWTRIEPRARDDDFSAGLEARTADPLWLLGRQWQMAEFDGEDTGSAIAVSVSFASSLVTKATWPPSMPTRERAAGPPLDTMIESEDFRWDWRR